MRVEQTRCFTRTKKGTQNCKGLDLTGSRTCRSVLFIGAESLTDERVGIMDIDFDIADDTFLASFEAEHPDLSGDVDEWMEQMLAGPDQD